MHGLCFFGWIFGVSMDGGVLDETLPIRIDRQNARLSTGFVGMGALLPVRKVVKDPIPWIDTFHLEQNLWERRILAEPLATPGRFITFGNNPVRIRRVY